MKNLLHFPLELLLEICGYGWQHPSASLQDSLHVCDADSVIGERHLLVLGAFHPETHLPLVEHTASTMNDKGVT